MFLYLKAVQILNYDAFSVNIIFKTLFAPWKRDVLDYRGLALNQMFQVWMLNISSRIIGFLVKILVLIAYLFAELIISILSILLAILWPFLPILFIYLVIFGFWLIING